MENLIKIEANIDNMNPEHYGGLLERLIDTGAKDAWLTPIIMKKGRPAVLLSVLCSSKALELMAELIFRETTTIGIRYAPWDRIICERHMETVTCPDLNASVQMKVAEYGGKVVNRSLEYEEIAAIAAQKGISWKDVEKKIWQSVDLSDRIR